jgi:CHAT domain-containing protein/Tfp pilus assembly protein PilF
MFHLRCAAWGLLTLLVLGSCPTIWAQPAKWEQLRVRVEELYQKGDYAAATPVAKEDLRVAVATFGATDPNVATALNNLGLLYEKQSQYSDAEPLFKRAVSIREKAFGPEDPQVARSLSMLAQVFEAEARYDDAEELYVRAYQIDKKVLGLDNRDVATILTNLGNLLAKEAKYADAETFLQLAVSIGEKALKPDDPDLAADLNNLAELYDSEDKFADEEPLLVRALAINEKAYGPDHPRVATALNNLAEDYEQEGNYAGAEPLFLRSLAIREKKFGLNNPEVADALNNLGEFRIAQGRYAEAERMLRRAREIDEKALGPDDSSVAVDLNNLAELYQTLGKTALAEPLFQRSLTIREKTDGLEQPDVATALNNLSALFVQEGRYEDARPLLMRALAIDRKTLPPYAFEIARDLNNLAELYDNQGKYADAEEAFKLALEIAEKVYGSEHPIVSTSLNNLAAVEVDQNKYKDAEPLYRRSLGIEEKVFGPEHPDLARTLNNLGSLLDDEGKYTEAEPLFDRALKIDDDVLGPDHPDNILTLNNFAQLYEDEGKFDKAEPLFARALNILFQQFEYNFTFMTEKQRLDFLGSVDYYFPTYFGFVYRYHDKDPKLAASMYNLLLWEKGFIAGSITDMRRRIAASGDKEALKLLEDLGAKQTEIAALLNAKPSDRNLWRKQIDQLRTEADELEKRLVERSSDFAEKTKLDRATWQQVRDALAPGEAAVEFARFRYLDKDSTQKSYYVALVITGETKDWPQYIVLGDDKQLEGDALTHFRQQLQTRGLAAEQEAVLPGANAWDLVWKPLETALAGTRRVYLSPDGALNEFPLGIIAAPDGNLAMEKYDLRILSSTKDILRNAAPALGNKAALLLGDPEFDLTGEQESAAMKKLVLKSSNAQSGVELPSPLGTLPSTEGAKELPRLPGTGAEVAAIADLMNSKGWKINLYTRDAALKVVVQQAESPVVVHLATHGFFLPDQQLKITRSDAAQNRSTVPEDPMLRSGLYFAGADRTLAGKPTPAGLDNGILTAMEAGNLNLSGTELVVLSACNTGQGDVKAGEGVFGLRRALQEAGARSVLMSMWSVPDKETTELMQRFYAKWFAGTEMHEALKQTQLESREEVKREHNGKDRPYYWGAFVLVGR